MSDIILEDDKYHRAKKWEIALFSLNNAASNLYLFSFGFLSYYAVNYVGILLLTVSNLLGAARLFDGLIDPTIGVIIDKFNTKRGKYRPLMLLSNIGLLLSFLFLFNLHHFEGTLRLVLFVIALIFHKIVYSFQTTITKAAQSALTTDPEQRPLFSLYDTIFSSIGVFALGQYFVASVLSPHFGGFTPEFYKTFLTIVFVLSLVFTLLAMKGISRKDNVKYFGIGEEATSASSIKEIWQMIKGNKPLGILAICGGFIKFVVQLLADQGFLILLFGIILGNFELSGDISVWQVIPQLIMIAVFTKFASKKGLKTAYRTSIGISAACFLGIMVLLAMAEDPTTVYSDSNLGIAGIAFVVLYILGKITANYPPSIILTMSADIADYESAKTGRYASGLIATIFSLTESIASSLAPIVVGWVLASIGYSSTYPEPTEALTPAIFNGGMILLGIVTVLLIVTFILSKYYPLDYKAMDQVQIAMNKRKAGDTDVDVDEAIKANS